MKVLSNIKKRFLLLGFIFYIFAPIAMKAQSEDDIVGLWYTAGKDAIIEIYKEESQRYFGKVVWLAIPKDENGNPKKDGQNKNIALRERPQLGLILATDFVYQGNSWKGQIYDVVSGKTYKAVIKMPDKNNLELTGYIGIKMIGRKSIWQRTNTIPN